MSLGCLYLVTLEVWKCGKCGNLEMCLGCLYLITLECGNESWLLLCSNSGRVEMSLGCLYVVTLEVWKCVLVVFIYA